MTRFLLKFCLHLSPVAYCVCPNHPHNQVLECFTSSYLFNRFCLETSYFIWIVVNILSLQLKLCSVILSLQLQLCSVILSLQLQLCSVILRRIARHRKEYVILNKCVHVSQHISVLLRACCDWSVNITVFVGCLCV